MGAIISGQTLRFAMVGLIVLVMLIPLLLVNGISSERQAYFETVFSDIASAWGQQQDLVGPFVVVPEVRRYSTQDGDGKVIWLEERRQRVYLPDALRARMQIDHEYRSRSIYEVPVYEANVSVEGSFIIPEPQESDTRLLRDEARVLFGLTHTQAIRSMSELQFGDDTYDFRASTGESWLGSGVHVQLAEILTDRTYTFAFAVDVKGTKSFRFAPVGASSEVTLASTWPHPSFGGRYLPDNFHVQPDGFTANWSVHELARNLPVSWIVDEFEIDLNESWASVSLFQPVTNYTVTDRGIKYGVLFIGLTFLTFICFEMMTHVLFHYVQYGVVGAALVLFYLALLSLSEHIAFGLAYVLATALLSGLIGWYVWMMTRVKQLTIWILSILIVLYLCLFVLLQLEAYALLVGTAILLVGLFALMYVTKNLTGATVEAEQLTREGAPA